MLNRYQFTALLILICLGVLLYKHIQKEDAAENAIAPTCQGQPW
jgi:hypothetical protein